MKKCDVINLLTNLKDVENENIFDYSDIVRYFGDDCFLSFINKNYKYKDGLVFINDVDNDVVFVVDDCVIKKVYFDVLSDFWKFL